MSASQARVLKGVPAAGQFAGTLHGEAATTLAPVPQPSNGMPRLGFAAAGYTDRFDEDGNLILQVRLENGRPHDAPDGTAAVIRYSKVAGGAMTESFYADGVLHDGSGDKPSERLTWPSGRSSISRGFRRPHMGYLTQQDSPDGQPASVQSDGAGDVLTTHCANGHRQDPAAGVPAMVRVLVDGSRRILHSPFGTLADLPDGTPSERHFDPAGNLSAEFRRHNGSFWDSEDGEPSQRHYWPDGTVQKEVFRYKDRILNPPSGKPAVTEYAADGSVIRTDSRPYLDDPYGPDFRFDQRPARSWRFARTEPVERHIPEAPQRKAD
ncbi:MAG TPA: hypothetical protein VF867_04415 [Arthrobacter sp.]